MRGNRSGAVTGKWSCWAAVAVVAVATFSAAPARAADPADDCALPRGLQGGEEIPNDWSFWLRPHGTVKARLLLVDFPDATRERSVAAVNSDFARTTDWFGTSSYGRLSYELIPATKWFRIPKNTAVYDDGANLDQLFRDAIAVADPDVNFAGTDIVIVANPVSAQLGSARASSVHASSAIKADGHPLRYIQRVWDDGFGVVLHESGHHFGLPDLYAYEGSNNHRFVGGWDTMGSGADRAGQDFFAWHKWKLEWLDDAQIVCVRDAGSEDHVLTPLETPGGVKAVVVRTGGHTAYVVENRQKLALDEASCEEGALVYSVDTHVGSGRGTIRVRSLTPDDPANTSYYSCGIFNTAPLASSEGDVTTFSDPSEGVTIEVVSVTGDDLVVRASKASPGARVNATLEVGRRGVARGRVTSPDSSGSCAAGARVRILRELYTSEGLRNIVVKTATAGSQGRYRVKIPRAVGWHKARVMPRTVDGTECFDDISPSWFVFG